MDPELMLEKGKTVVRQREAVHEQQVIIKGVRLQAPQLLEGTEEPKRYKKQTSTPVQKLCTQWFVSMSLVLSYVL